LAANLALVAERPQPLPRRLARIGLWIGSVVLAIFVPLDRGQQLIVSAWDVVFGEAGGGRAAS